MKRTSPTAAEVEAYAWLTLAEPTGASPAFQLTLPSLRRVDRQKSNSSIQPKQGQAKGLCRILIATVPILGHIGPLLQLSRELVARGHDVRWYSGRNYAGRIEASGARLVSFAKARDYDDRKLDSEFPGRSTFTGLDQMRFDLRRIFIDGAGGQLADIETLVGEWCPDVLVSDPVMLGALLAHEKLKIPLVIISVLPCTIRSSDTAPFGLGIAPMGSILGHIRNAALNQIVEQVVFRSVQRHWQRTRASLGLPKGPFLFDAPSHISSFLLPTIPGFEYSRERMPAHVQFIGILPAGEPYGAQLPAWFGELDGSRPVVHVSQGTIANAKPDLIAPAIEGLANEDMLVVVSTGGRRPEDLGLARVPDNVRVAAFLPYPELLPRTAVMVTNGGYGGVQIALSHGVPLVVAGTTEDKLEVAARVAWSGAGINLKTSTPTAQMVRRAVCKILAETRFRTHAKRLSVEYAQYDAIKRGADSIENTVSALQF